MPQVDLAEAARRVLAELRHQQTKLNALLLQAEVIFHTIAVIPTTIILKTAPTVHLPQRKELTSLGVVVVETAMALETALLADQAKAMVKATESDLAEDLAKAA